MLTVLSLICKYSEQIRIPTVCLFNFLVEVISDLLVPDHIFSSLYDLKMRVKDCRLSFLAIVQKAVIPLCAHCLNHLSRPDGINSESYATHFNNFACFSKFFCFFFLDRCQTTP